MQCGWVRMIYYLIINFLCKHFLLISVHIGILDSGEIQQFAYQIKDELEMGERSLEILTCAAALAHRGFIKDVEDISLIEIDLRTVPTKHLASLTSTITEKLDINFNVRGCDLVAIFDSLQCTELELRCENYGMEVTQALVRAMESGVKEVIVHYADDSDLDIDALTKYRRQGRCRFLKLSDVIDTDFFDELLDWARLETKWYYNYRPEKKDDDDEEEDNGNDDEEEKVKTFALYLMKKEEDDDEEEE